MEQSSTSQPGAGCELTVEIVTRSGVEYQGRVAGVVFPGADGYIGVHQGHASLLTSMGTGIATLAAPAQTVYVAISGGVAEVHDNTVTLLAEVAELATEIDTSRAQRAAERARKRLEAAYCGPGGEVIVDVERARTALARAINRLHTAEKAGMLG